MVLKSLHMLNDKQYFLASITDQILPSLVRPSSPKIWARRDGQPQTLPPPSPPLIFMLILQQELPLHIQGKQDGSWGQPGQATRQSGHLFWPHSDISECLLLASASNFEHYKLINFRAETILNRTLVQFRSTCVCPQPARFEHSLSIITFSKAGGEGAQGSSAW